MIAIFMESILCWEIFCYVGERAKAFFFCSKLNQFHISQSVSMCSARDELSSAMLRPKAFLARMKYQILFFLIEKKTHTERDGSKSKKCVSTERCNKIKIKPYSAKCFSSHHSNFESLKRMKLIIYRIKIVIQSREVYVCMCCELFNPHSTPNQTTESNKFPLQKNKFSISIFCFAS